MDRVNLAGIAFDSVTDGPGLRLVLFAQGCDHKCSGCHNPSTWDFHGGRSYTLEELVSLVERYGYVDGVTFSGGEPFYQAGPLALLGKKLKTRGYTIVTYTGFPFEEIQRRAAGGGNSFGELLEVTDLLVDGPYLHDARDPGLAFRGSANQRLVDVPCSLKSGRAVLYDLAKG